MEIRTMFNGKDSNGLNVLARIFDENGKVVYEDKRTDAEMLAHFDAMFERKRPFFKNIELMEKLQKIFNADYNEVREYSLMQFLVYGKHTQYRTWLRLQVTPEEWKAMINPDEDMKNDLHWFFD